MCTDDIFKAQKKKKEMLKKDKVACKTAEEIEKKALGAILETLEVDPQKKFTGSKLCLLSSFYGVKKKKHSKNVVEARSDFRWFKIGRFITNVRLSTGFNTVYHVYHVLFCGTIFDSDTSF